MQRCSNDSRLQGHPTRIRAHLLVQMLIFSAVRGGMSSCATFQAAPEPSGALISTTLPCDAATHSRRHCTQRWTREHAISRQSPSISVSDPCRLMAMSAIVDRKRAVHGSTCHDVGRQ